MENEHHAGGRPLVDHVRIADQDAGHHVVQEHFVKIVGAGFSEVQYQDLKLEPQGHGIVVLDERVRWGS